MESKIQELEKIIERMRQDQDQYRQASQEASRKFAEVAATLQSTKELADRHLKRADEIIAVYDAKFKKARGLLEQLISTRHEEEQKAFKQQHADIMDPSRIL